MLAPFAGVTGPVAITAVALAFAWLAVASTTLAVIDARTHRLPNAWVLPGYPVLSGLLLVACLAGAPWTSLVRAAIGGVVLFVFYAVLRAAGGGMGGGDVKLAGVLGMALGWTGWPALAVGALAGFVFGGLYGTILLATRRAHRRTAVAFGPWMLLGAWTGIVFGAETATGLGL
ncbi:prepilin peptidase [Microbacterium oleivorans]|uniref:prepilin peptidase n=1 Tax=Microbacterium oleivorans TaxID=273677 RepID=UPI00203F7E9F|nr:A24 family peptidase [Microbacterium oleivorans]MCM3696368.1 A24 family peptidase [Microbacterium oleivorans]